MISFLKLFSLLKMSAPSQEEVQEFKGYHKLSTVGFDARFPNQNQVINTDQTKNCWQNYVDYFKCVEVKGEDDAAACFQFRKAYHTLCPLKWVNVVYQIEKWDGQREENVFPPLRKEETSHH